MVLGDNKGHVYEKKIVQILEERQIKQQQDKEYQESLIQDENNKMELKFKEVSIEEMRRIRLQRFSK